MSERGGSEKGAVSARHGGREIAILAGIAVLYWAAARLGLLLAFEYKNVSPVWPPSGVALAALLLIGLRGWPAITVGAFLANYTTGLPFLTSALISGGNTLEALAGASVLLGVSRFDRTLGSPRDVTRIVIAAAVSSSVAASTGVTALVLTTSYVSWADFPLAWFTWWFGDTMGVLVFGTVLLSWSAWLKERTINVTALPGPSRTGRTWRSIEALVLALCLLLLMQFVFGRSGVYPFATFPVLIWAALRFGQRGAITSVAAIAGLAIWATVHNSGPFARSDLQLSLLYLQTYVAVVATTALVLGATVTQWARSEEALRSSENRFRLALENSDIVVYSQDIELRYTWIYDGKHRFDPGRVVGRTDAELTSPDEARRLSEIKQRVMQTGVGERQEVVATTHDSTRIYELVVEPLLDSRGAVVGVSGVAHDVSDVKRYQADVESLNERLRRSMRETHHRVKNNLQIIAAMVDMRLMDGSASIPSEEVRRLGRITTTLATVHDLLTHEARDGGSALTVSSKKMIDELVSMLQPTTLDRPVEVHVEDMALSTRQATSLAIVISELVGNAVKHGKGTIRIEYSQTGSGARLSVTDGGDGFPEGFDASVSSGTGLDLVRSLSRLDLAGDTKCFNPAEGGACVAVSISPLHAIPSTTK